MLKQLNLKNIILIENAEISFEGGFNVLSGETGSGKSAILGALNHIAGNRADTGVVRKGEEVGTVEALFNIDNLPRVKKLLKESGIEHDEGEELIVRREIHASGKSRAFINNQMAQVSFLRKVSERLLDIVGQHANQKLLSVENHREIVDLYGELENQVDAFTQSWNEEKRVRKELETLIAEEAQRLRDVEVCRMELEELREAAIKEGEEEELFAEYTLLTNAEELAKNAHDISSGCDELLPGMQQMQKSLERLSELDKSMEETVKTFKGVLLECEEIGHTIRTYKARIEFNPAKIEEVNGRLTLINKLKKKYGDVWDYEKEVATKLERLENSEEEIDGLKEQLSELEKKTNVLGKELTKKRKCVGEELEKAIAEQLRALNMPKAEFFVEVSQEKRTRHGDDKVEFFLIPNVGENRIPIRECASGGELSRLMLALQTLLAGKEQTPTIIFDEIDANIGGETATVVGDKLKQIGDNHQVLCVTHFPQVAQCAKHHLQISKTEKGGRTVTLVNLLNEHSKKKELSRMAGGTAK